MLKFNFPIGWNTNYRKTREESGRKFTPGFLWTKKNYPSSQHQLCFNNKLHTTVRWILTLHHRMANVRPSPTNATFICRLFLEIAWGSICNRVCGTYLWCNSTTTCILGVINHIAEKNKITFCTKILRVHHFCYTEYCIWFVTMNGM